MKKIISSIIFIILTVALLFQVTDLLMPKAINRYYIMDKYLAENDTYRDVQAFGSCHTYTSFNPAVLEKNTGLTSYIYANPGEIIPTTYVRMVEQFKKHVPKVAVLDIWGINAYETYDETEEILEEYMPLNVQMLPNSKEKTELINDFESLDYWEMCFPISQYKTRLLDDSLTALDFDYNVEGLAPFSIRWIVTQMEKRQSLNGFVPQSPQLVEDYYTRQLQVSDDFVVEIEPVIVKYLEKIFALCEEYDVELILYRAPYLATENELGKLKHLKQLCQEHDVLFLDLEQEVDFSVKSDFSDYYHLSPNGAEKATQYLEPYILDAINK